ncbi:cupin [Ruania halotolerans]|uniref:cupin n=1 Tax=Ruania halotolerans TaxID=2897773 RepID=UPI001E50AFA9|nr:cupin [Ruania halotolerans]UFU07476.1 cupin [Ruania halotolerans]
MDDSAPTVRAFGTHGIDGTDGSSLQFGDRQLFIRPAVDTSEGRLFSAYSARFGRGERADLPAPYEEVWVVVQGWLRIHTACTDITAGAGDYLHVPKNTPGEVEALEETTLVCISVPAH